MFAQMHTIPVINVKANFFDGKCHNFLMALFYGLLNTPYMYKCFHLIGMTFVYKIEKCRHVKYQTQ